MTIRTEVHASCEVNGLACAYRQGEAAAIFAAVDAFAGPALNQALCTINRYDEPAQQVVRLYSSDPSAYPVGGSKNKAGTAWGRHVLHDQQVFVGEGCDAIRSFFDDHRAIQALGLQSVINVPVVYGGRCLGTVNYLMRTAQVTECMVRVARLAALLAVPGFLGVLNPV